ncbi:hypothetical protein U8527_21480 [Kordia algicida OT-1]|uniref:Uncharacterized protein n=1 Tax=Kordia algicida OT-1 TaxID=391587 RepID=A9DLK5_9FLAO|nr:hypothetical protein [Kordia algicida]EDP98586.1 hypothetical protein KAOT1_15252 [Kordia algicida OT-1]
MEKIAFDLVTKKKGFKQFSNSEKIYYLGFIGIVLVIGIGVFLNYVFEINILQYQWLKYMAYGALLCIFIGTFKAFREYDKSDYETSGILFIDAHKITVDYTEDYPLSEIAFVKFTGYDVKGSPINSLSEGSPKKSMGGENYVTFQHKNKKYKYQFIVISKAQRQVLIEKIIPKMQLKTKVTYS